MISLATLEGIGILRAVIQCRSHFFLGLLFVLSFFTSSVPLRSSSIILHSCSSIFVLRSLFFSLAFRSLVVVSFINLAENHTSTMSSFDKFLNPAFCANNINSPCPNKTSKANNACSRCYLVVVSPPHFDLFKALYRILTKIKTVLQQRMPKRTLARAQRGL